MHCVLLIGAGLVEIMIDSGTVLHCTVRVLVYFRGKAS